MSGRVMIIIIIIIIVIPSVFRAEDCCNLCMFSPVSNMLTDVKMLKQSKTCLVIVIYVTVCGLVLLGLELS